MGLIGHLIVQVSQFISLVGPSPLLTHTTLKNQDRNGAASHRHRATDAFFVCYQPRGLGTGPEGLGPFLRLSLSTISSSYLLGWAGAVLMEGGDSATTSARPHQVMMCVRENGNKT